MYAKLIFCLLAVYFYAAAITDASIVPCRHLNAKCKFNLECCSKNCYNGKCQDCKLFHKQCSNKKECCTGDCSRVYDKYQFNGLSIANYCCKPSVGNDTRCKYDWECCATPKTKASQADWTLTTSCQNGHCKPCTQLYHTCLNTTNSRKCCVGVCANIYKSDTYNKLSVDQNCCLKGNAYCNYNQQCCSQNCIKKGTNVYGQCRDCKYLTQGCSILSQCCAGICAKPWPYKPWTLKQCCLPNLQKCKNNGDCCSKRCGQFNKLGFGKCLPHLPFPIRI